jgi:hypothetical protein
MSFIQNIFTSRDNNANSVTYVGQTGRIWWNPDTNAFYSSDGNTAGGVPISVANTANVTLNTATITGNLVVLGNISPAGNNKVGGIFPGPGVVIGNTGQLTINSANLPISFGNFTASNNVLSIVNVDENMILITSGNAEVQLIGNVGFYKPDGLPPNTANRYAEFNKDGQVTFYIPTADADGAIRIIGSTSGNSIPPGQTGAMLHVTGQLSIPNRLYFDGNDNYVSLVTRRFNGNVSVPTQVLAGQDVFRLNATAATNAGVGNVAFAQIRATALENQTTTAQGSQLVFTVTPVGSDANARVDVANITTANGVNATKFTTAGTISATGNITGGNVLTSGLVSVTGNITGGNVLTGGLVSATGNITGGNVLTSGLVNVTANITGGNILTGGLVSATGNITGGNVTAAKFTGNLVGSASNLTVNTSSTAGTFLTGQANIPSQVIAKNTTSVNVTVTVTGLTTSHKVIVTPAINLNAGIFVSAAYPSTANTLGIQLQNTTGGAITTSAFDLTYLAWV